MLSIGLDTTHGKQVINLLLLFAILLHDIFLMLALTDAGNHFPVLAGTEKFEALLIPELPCFCRRTLCLHFSNCQSGF